MVSLANFETIHRGLLNLPEDDNRDDGILPLISFSPNLELILVGNALLEVRAPKAEPLSLPIPEVSGNKQREFLGHDWTCTFSACSRYIALMNEPVISNEYQAKLILFHFDMQGKTCARFFKDIRVTQYYRLTVDFHPYRPEMVLNGWIKGDPAAESLSPYMCQADKITDVTSILLDFENGNSINLGRPTIHGAPCTGKTRRRSRVPDSLLTRPRLMRIGLGLTYQIFSMRILHSARLRILSIVIVAHPGPLQAIHTIAT